MKEGEDPKKCISYIYKTTILTEFTRHAALNLFSPPQNATYFIMLCSVVYTIFIFFIKVW
jgi:hypothetical protein